MVELIAEIGWNHLGDMELAKQMVHAAAKSGADFIKFQTWTTDRLKPGPWDTDGRRQLYEKAQLSVDDHFMLRDECLEAGAKFLTSVFNPVDVQLIRSLGCEDIKVPSTEIANVELLGTINDVFRDSHVILSTGAAEMAEVKQALGLLNRTTVTLMHCVSAYPCPIENANLRRIDVLREFLGDDVGYSGHCEGIDDAVASLEYGVTLIEKHFTTSCTLPGRDNRFSLMPYEFEKLADYVKKRELMNGDRGIDFQDIEKDARDNYRGRWCLKSGS